jgi:hypothetical protein
VTGPVGTVASAEAAKAANTPAATADDGKHVHDSAHETLLVILNAQIVITECVCSQSQAACPSN